jgi:23S rRNA (adenine2503-C2)-methyltransferase
MTEPIDLTEFTLSELEQLLGAWGQPPFRARQVLKWLYKGVSDFADMTDIARSFRAELAAKTSLGRLRLEAQQEAPDGCRKFLFALADGNLIESVLIPEEGHFTLCLSSQVGCAQGCRFCLTARRGLRRNLQAGEIVQQILAVRRQLPADRPLTNLVFMGMGEPLANFAALVRALTIIAAPWGLNFSPRRLTVATVALAELLAACQAFPLPRHRRITFAYVLLAGVNDAPNQARQLARLLRGFRAKINLIPFNPHPRLPFSRPPESRILEFQEILRQCHYTVMIRESRGQEIAAACGQLAGQRA